MPQITLVEPQKNPPDGGLRRFNIFIDRQFAFGADEDLVVNYRLVVGKTIQKEDLDKLLFEAEVGKLMERIYGLLSVRMRSEKEIRDYLKSLSFKRKIKSKEEISETAIELLINRLKQKGLISDLEFAKAWVTSRRRSKQKGIQALKAELYQKGISREIIKEVIEVGSQESSEEELASKALEKKIKSWKNLEPMKLKLKAYRFLFSKGFEYSIIKSAVAKILQKG